MVLSVQWQLREGIRITKLATVRPDGCNVKDSSISVTFWHYRSLAFSLNYLISLPHRSSHGQARHTSCIPSKRHYRWILKYRSHSAWPVQDVHVLPYNLMNMRHEVWVCTFSISKQRTLRSDARPAVFRQITRYYKRLVQIFKCVKDICVTIFRQRQAKRCFRTRSKCTDSDSFCGCATFYPGICSPMMYLIVSNDFFFFFFFFVGEGGGGGLVGGGGGGGYGPFKNIWLISSRSSI